MEKAVYTGSFDPITLGHLDVIRRSSRLVQSLVVGIGVNTEKQGMFTIDERIELVERCTADLGNVTVRAFEGLAVEFVSACGSRVMIRGIRPLTDIAAEITMTMANRQLDQHLETVFLVADSRYAHVSSSLIKQIAPLADDEQLARFIPESIIPDLRKKMRSHV